jgi:hypothetical protein
MDKLAKLNFAHLSPLGFNCFERYFRYINYLNDRFLRSEMELKFVITHHEVLPPQAKKKKKYLKYTQKHSIE